MEFVKDSWASTMKDLADMKEKSTEVKETLEKATEKAMEKATEKAKGIANRGLPAYFSDTSTPYYCDDPVKNQAEWMKNVPDDTKIVDMFIPGTHNTGASAPYGKNLGPGIGQIAKKRLGIKSPGNVNIDTGLSCPTGPWAVCQTWTIEEQLNSGIRAFDLRVAYEEGLGIYHGEVPFDVSYHDCAKVLAEFVNKHKSECVFVRIKQTHRDLAWRDRKNKGFYKDYIYVGKKRYPRLEDEINLANMNHFKKNQFREEKGMEFRFHKFLKAKNKFPTIGQLRGKVVYFPEDMKGISGPKWNGGGKNDIQDKWNMDNVDLKWDLIKAHATKARQKETYYINFVSCVKFPNTPAGMALELNKKLFDENLDGFKGSFYMMDFPGTGLVKRIIQKNLAEDNKA